MFYLVICNLTAKYDSYGIYFTIMNSNTFGKLFSLTSFGESHGKAIGGIVDGCPVGEDEGCPLGFTDGCEEGCVEGYELGCPLGSMDGCEEGCVEGRELG